MERQATVTAEKMAVLDALVINSISYFRDCEEMVLCE